MMIQTEHLSKTYKNGFQAVKDLNLQVNKGDIFGFLGTNGAGKTTTIRMLDGILQPTAGSVVIDGMDVQKKPLEIKKIIGVVPESHGYYDWMTATEYLQYFDTLFNGKNVNNHYINELLSKVGLEGKRNVLVGHFSRGMKQRLGIAKALINHPKVVFLDEPTLGLDPRGQKDKQQSQNHAQQGTSSYGVLLDYQSLVHHRWRNIFRFSERQPWVRTDSHDRYHGYRTIDRTFSSVQRNKICARHLLANCGTHQCIRNFGN